MIILLLALIAALVILAILSAGRLLFGRREKFEMRKFGPWFIRYFIFNFIFSFVILYLGQPALTGPFGGWQWILWPLAFSCIGCLFTFLTPALGMLEGSAMAGRGRSSSSTSSISSNSYSRGAVAAGIFGLVIVAVLGIAAPLLITVFTTWFDVNAKALAAIPQVHMQSSSDLPPTDQNHIVLVSQNVASYEGQQVLGSTGQNLGSAYSIDPTTYTLQSIKHHLYYVAPLEYNNLFVNLSSPTTPGFVVVDAENPKAVPKLWTDQVQAGSSIGYLPGALLNQDLLRHVYLSGYTYGRLLDPTLELDDNFKPYWTISLMQPIRGYVGDDLREVLIVDAHTGVIAKYSPNAVPAWVDRVLPSDTVTQYLEWWGLYHSAPWFNPSGLGQQKPAGSPQLLYNNVDQPVWLIPMTSASASDNSSTGIFLYDTHKNEGSFYPLTGLGIGSNVNNTFSSTHWNIKNYTVDSVQLYQIANTPTWVAIYVEQTDSGDIFQAVGMVSARALNGANVQFESTLPQVLTDYQQWLSSQGAGGGGNVASGGTTQTVSGKVLRVSVVSQGSNVTYYLQIAGQPALFKADLSLSPKLPLVQPGDTITGTYLNTGGTLFAFQSFDDSTIALGTPAVDATPVATATPTAKKK